MDFCFEIGETKTMEHAVTIQKQRKTKSKNNRKKTNKV